MSQVAAERLSEKSAGEAANSAKDTQDTEKVTMILVMNLTVMMRFLVLVPGQGSVAEMAERQPPSGETGVRSLPAAPSSCGRVTSVLNSLVG